jgi:hypothetical protein
VTQEQEMDRARMMTLGGWILTLGVTAFMLSDVSYDLREVKMAVEANAAIGIPADAVLPIGIIGLVCTLLYVFPRTATLGAILLTGFLGGAVVTHLRVHGSLHDMSENVLIGVFAWSGLWLRDARIRRIMPIRFDTGKRVRRT